ncbi:MAG: flippase [Candidatus Omnitrophica bacterium]|nr:flippase [Candidatus Omnitrophota bacterium]
MRFLVQLIQKTYQMVAPQEGSKVLRNVSLLSSLQVITYILPFIILPYLFRVIGPNKFGLIAFAQAFVQYFMILTDYGFSVSATKEISLCIDNKTRVSEVYSAVMMIKVLLTIVSLVILMGLLYTIPKFQNDRIIYILSFGAVIGNTLFPGWFFQGSEAMKYTFKINVLGEFIYALGIFAFIRSDADYLWVPVVTSLTSLTTGLVGQYILFTRFQMAFKIPALKDLRYQLQTGWNVFISIVAINAYTTTRVFAVGLLTNNTLTGFYSIADRIANAVQTFPLYSFTQAIFPRLNKIFPKNKIKAFLIMRQVQLITVLISLIFLPVIFILAPWIVKLVCGAYYPAAVMTLQLLLVAVFFISANAFRVQFLLICGRTDVYSKIHVTMGLIGLPLIIICIHAFSYAGAAMATLLIEAGVFTLTWLSMNRIASALNLYTE